MKIVLVRHGETEFRDKGLLDGMTDTAMNENGTRQAKELAPKLKKYNFKKIFSSTLKRSIDTAEIIKQELGLNLPIEKIESFREIDCGDCNGKSHESIGIEYPELVKEWAKNTDPPFPNGESLKDVGERALPEFLKIIKENMGSDGDILIAGHGALNIALVGHFLKIPYGYRWKIKQSNCCINEISFGKDMEDYKVNKINC